MWQSREGIEHAGKGRNQGRYRPDKPFRRRAEAEHHRRGADAQRYPEEKEDQQKRNEREAIGEEGKAESEGCQNNHHDQANQAGDDGSQYQVIDKMFGMKRGDAVVSSGLENREWRRDLQIIMRFLLPTGGKCGNESPMKIGRNDPCPCSSGKKYKKCCLQKDEAAARLATAASEVTEPEKNEPFEAGWDEPETPEGAILEQTGDSPVEPPAAPVSKFPRPNEELPELPPEQEKIIKDWWDKTIPLYQKRDADGMMRRIDLALNEFPGLFVHLGLHEEFLFELGAELGRRGRMPEYAALLKRLRGEQRQMYSFCYGAYDLAVISELVVTGEASEIPAYLDLFRQYPDAQPDYCHQVCNLLAWSGLDEALYLLCEAVALPMMTSSEVIGGHFVLDWLIRREEIPFFERGDASPPAIRAAAEATKQLGERIGFPLKPDLNWLLIDLTACTEVPQVSTQGTLGKKAQRRLELSFVSHLARESKIRWVHGFCLGDLLLDYFEWCREERVPWVQFRKKDVEKFAVYRSKHYLWINGVTLLAILQGTVWFAEYLGSSGIVPSVEGSRVRKECEELFETGRKAVDASDPAYRICPTFERLVGKL